MYCKSPATNVIKPWLESTIIFAATVITKSPTAPVNPCACKSASEIVIVSFKAYPVPIAATVTADKALAPSPVTVIVAPVPVPDVEDCAIVKGPSTFPIVVAAVLLKISCPFINCPVPKAPAAITNTSAAS